MGSITAIWRNVLLLVLALTAVCACARADTTRKLFDVPAQPAASALNEFAKQADIALIFSYDLVATTRTRPLKGRYTVGDGLSRMLEGTPLAYRQAKDGTYLICLSASCVQNSEQSQQAIAEKKR